MALLAMYIDDDGGTSVVHILLLLMCHSIVDQVVVVEVFVAAWVLSLPGVMLCAGGGGCVPGPGSRGPVVAGGDALAARDLYYH